MRSRLEGQFGGVVELEVDLDLVRLGAAVRAVILVVSEHLALLVEVMHPHCTLLLALVELALQTHTPHVTNTLKNLDYCR